MKAYRLLRNNKELGPYSVEELKGLNLKAYDLIWVDGKSASWRYPGEIPELESFAPPVQEQPFDRFYKKADDKKQQPEQQKKAVPVASANSNPVKQEKPRIRVKAEWNFAETPDKKTEIKPAEVAQPDHKKEEKPKEPPANNTANNNNIFGWKEALNDWTAERKTVEKKVAAPVSYEARQENVRQPQPVSKPTAFKNDYDLKPASSNADEQEKLINSYYEKKAKSAAEPAVVSKKKITSYLNLVAPAVFLIAVAAFAYYMNKKADVDDVTKKSDATKITANTGSNDTQSQGENIENGNLNATQGTDDGSVTLRSNNENLPANESTKAQNKQANNNTAAGKPETVETVTKTVSKNIPLASDKVSSAAANKNITRPPVPNTSTQVKEAQAKETASGTPANTAKQDAGTSAEINNAPAPEKKAPATIGSFVQMQTVTQPEGNKRLQVRNISDYKLDLVVVDIQYYDAGNKFTKGESIYLHNIPAGKNMLVNTPDDKSASRITAKVSLVSSDEKGVYLVGE